MNKAPSFATTSLFYSFSARTSFFIALIFLSGCAVGPNYCPPEQTLSDEWNAQDSFSTQKPLSAWWNAFEDPLLTTYIEQAVQCNNDLLKAEAAIVEARALRQMAASKFFPQVNMDFSAVKTYFSKNGPVFAISPGDTAGGGIPSTTTGLPFNLQIPQIQNLFTFLFDASWEIDFFGKTRRTVEAADAHAESVIEERNNLLITTLAEVARNYLELRSFQTHRELLHKQIDLLEHISKITTAQWNAGYVNRLDLDIIEAELAKTRSALPEMHAQIYRNIYSLALLTGNLPEALVEDLLVLAPLPQLPNNIAVGLRSDLLKRRPDVRRAERELAAATALVGVAVASFYPTFTLLGDGGLQSLQLRNLFQAASRTFALGGDLNMPVFQGGKLIGNLRASEARTCMAGYSYQQTVLNALSETEQTLTAYSDDLEKIKEWTLNVELLSDLAHLTNQRYQKGLSGLIQSLDSDRLVINAKINLLQSSSSALLDLVKLYKALGGGWEQPEAPSVDGE
jgi:NodT family efflux transporter outer membrane factor (OMF) lipoprotein